MAAANGGNTEMVNFILAVQEISKNADEDNIESLYDCVNQYLVLCAQSNMKVSNLMAYMACGLDYNKVSNWATGKSRRKQPEYQQFAVQLKDLCAAYREQISVEGKLNPVLAIWHQKVYDGYREDALPELAEETERESTSDSIAARYSDL